MTLDFVQQQLIHHEQSQESKSENPHDSALVRAQKRKPPKCWSCDEVGHIQRFCPKRKEKSQHRAKVTEDQTVTVKEHFLCLMKTGDWWTQVRLAT